MHYLNLVNTWPFAVDWKGRKHGEAGQRWKDNDDRQKSGPDKWRSTAHKNNNNKRQPQANGPWDIIDGVLNTFHCMRNTEWRVRNGEWSAENGEREMENGERRRDNGERIRAVGGGMVNGENVSFCGRHRSDETAKYFSHVLNVKISITCSKCAHSQYAQATSTSNK